MTEEADERLRQFLNEGRNWVRKATNILGVFLFRLPATKGRHFGNRDIKITRRLLHNFQDLSSKVT